MRLLPRRGDAKGGQAVNNLFCPHCRSGHDPVLKDSTWSCGVRFNDPQWRTKECYKRNLELANERIKRLEDCIEGAWCLIANVSQGDWKLQHLHWQESVAQWMEKEMYPIYKEISKRKAKEAKP